MADASINMMDKLPDDNWSYWRKVMYAILKKDKVWDIVIGTQRAPSGVDATEAAIDEFVNKQEKACGWLVPSISSSLAYLIPNEPNDPAAIWDNLSDHFESKSPFNVFHLQNQLAQLMLNDREDPVPWIRQRVELYDRLSQLGKTVADDDQCMATIILLPKLYLSFVTSLTTQLAQGALNMKQLCDFLANYRNRHREVKYMKKMRTRLVQGLAANIVVVVVQVVGAMAMDVIAARRVASSSAVVVWDTW